LTWNTEVTSAGLRYGYEELTVRGYAPWLCDADFQSVYQMAKPNTLVDVCRCYELWDLVKEVRRVEGDVLEVGVWRGGTGAIIASAAKRWKPSAKVHLCDTFSGVVKAGSLDSDYKGGEHADTSVDIVVSLLQKLNLGNCQILEGVFPDNTAEKIGDAKISFCHIDVDVYESARQIVEWLIPRTDPGAHLVFDDYGVINCRGITTLVNELRNDELWRFFYNINGHAILTRK
jgi:O-methyltransferase